MQDGKYSKTPLVELISQMTYLERDINLKMMMYEEMRQEVVRRFPIIEEEDCFKQKTLEIKREKR